MLNTTVPFLQAALSPDGISEMTAEKFQEICIGVHAIKDYSRRVANKAVALPEGTPPRVAASVICFIMCCMVVRRNSFPNACGKV